MNLDASANRLVNLEVIVKDRSNASVVVLERKFHAGLINFGQTYVSFYLLISSSVLKASKIPFDLFVYQNKFHPL